MSNETKKLVAKEIEILLPVKKFDPKLRDMHSKLCELFAEDLLKKMPEGLEVYEADGRPLIRRKKEGKEGFEEMLRNASDFSFNAETMPTIVELLEESVDPTWNKLINEKFINS